MIFREKRREIITISIVIITITHRATIYEGKSDKRNLPGSRQKAYRLRSEFLTITYEAITGGEISNRDSGALWYDASNIDDPEVAQALYE